MEFWPTGSASKKPLWRLTGLKTLYLCIVTTLLFSATTKAQDLKPVALELVLALDSSASVDAREFKLQLRGLARAFGNRDVSTAIANLAPLGVAVAVIQWGGAGETRLIIPFTVLNSKAEAIAFGLRIAHSRRLIRATDTSITTAIQDAQKLLDENGFDGQRRVIDISGDGRDNSGLDIDGARRSANRARITINGLPIAADENIVTQYYRDHVITGADSFVEPAKDFEDYARAIKAKLLRELLPLAS